MITEAEVLNLLDETMTYERGDIPPPPDICNINFRFVEGRLSVFRNEHDWVIASEIVAYVPPACAYEHSLHLYGNCIQGQVQWILRELPARIDVQELWDNRTGAFWQGGIVFASSGATNGWSSLRRRRSTRRQVSCSLQTVSRRTT